MSDFDLPQDTCDEAAPEMPPEEDFALPEDQCDEVPSEALRTPRT